MGASFTSIGVKKGNFGQFKGPSRCLDDSWWWWDGGQHPWVPPLPGATGEKKVKMGRGCEGAGAPRGRGGTGGRHRGEKLGGKKRSLGPKEGMGQGAGTWW